MDNCKQRRRHEEWKGSTQGPPTTASLYPLASPLPPALSPPSLSPLQEVRALLTDGFDLDVYNEAVTLLNGAYAKLF